MADPDPTPPPLGGTRRRIVDALKRRALTGPELAERFGVTTEAVRLHLAALTEHGLVTSAPRSGSGRGRPPVEWTLTELAADLFPDRHADLTVSLIESIRSTVGEDGLDAIVAARSARQVEDYRRRLDGTERTDRPDGGPSGGDPAGREATDGDPPDRLTALAAIRTDEGYEAEVVDAPDGPGRLLIEHHCPICDAARACQGLCQGELELFRDVLGPEVVVTREQHLLSGDRRCVYRVEPAPAVGQASRFGTAGDG